MKREIQLVKNTFIIAFGTILPKCSSIITLPIITMNLTQGEYGTYDLITTLVALLLPIISLQIQSAAFRFLIDCEEKLEKRTIISTIVCFVLCVMSICFSVLWVLLKELSLEVRILVVIYYGLDIFYNVLQQITRGLKNTRAFSASAIILSVINMFMVVLTLRYFQMGLCGVLFSVCVATMGANLYLLYKIRFFSYFHISFFSKKKLKDLLDYSWPMIPNTLSNWIMNLSDRIVISVFWGIEANAVYSVANKIPNLFTSLQGTFVMAWQENASIAAKDDDICTYYTKMFETVFRIYFAVMSFMIALTPVLFNLLIKGNYVESYSQIPILFISLFFSAIASFLGGIYVAIKQTKSIGITTTIAAMVNLLVNLLLIKHIGLYAASISTLLSYLILSGYRMKNIKKYVDIEYNYFEIMVMTLLLCVMAGFCFLRNVYLNGVNILMALVLSVVFNKDLVRKYIR